MVALGNGIVQGLLGLCAVGIGLIEVGLALLDGLLDVLVGGLSVVSCLLCSLELGGSIGCLRLCVFEILLCLESVVDGVVDLLLGSILRSGCVSKLLLQGCHIVGRCGVVGLLIVDRPLPSAASAVRGAPEPTRLRPTATAIALRAMLGFFMCSSNLRFGL